MIFYSSLDPDFPYKDCEQLYNDNKKYNVCPTEFSELLECLKGHFWAVTDDCNNLMGCIYFEIRGNDKWFLSGFSRRGVTQYVVDAIHTLAKHYDKKELYAETDHKHAVYALLRTGFKKLRYNIYKWGA